MSASDVLKEAVQSPAAAAPNSVAPPVTPMMMSALLLQTMCLERLQTLAEEYRDKFITPERFAARVYAALQDHDSTMQQMMRDGR